MVQTKQQWIDKEFTTNSCTIAWMILNRSVNYPVSSKNIWWWWWWCDLKLRIHPSILPFLFTTSLNIKKEFTKRSYCLIPVNTASKALLYYCKWRSWVLKNFNFWEVKPVFLTITIICVLFHDCAQLAELYCYWKGGTRDDLLLLL